MRGVWWHLFRARCQLIHAPGHCADDPERGNPIFIVGMPRSPRTPRTANRYREHALAPLAGREVLWWNKFSRPIPR